MDLVATVHGTGTIRKGDDREYTSAASVPLIPTLALVLENFPGSRGSRLAAGLRGSSLPAGSRISAPRP